MKNNSFLNAMRRSIGKTYFDRPGLHTLSVRGNSSRGMDAGSRAAGFNYLTTGVPNNARYRRYFALTPPNT